MATLQTGPSASQQASLLTSPTVSSAAPTEAAQPTDALAAALPPNTDTTEATEAADVVAIAAVPVPPEPAVPTEPPLPTPSPTPSPIATANTPLQNLFLPDDSPVIVLPTLETLTNQERWRREQIGREPFPAVRSYATTGSELWWFDPVQQQHVILGTIAGTFEVQATFTLRGQGIAALEVPYQVNRQYGLTALSPALVGRIQAAGYGEWIETYVFDGSNVQPQ